MILTGPSSRRIRLCSVRFTHRLWSSTVAGQGQATRSESTHVQTSRSFGGHRRCQPRLTPPGSPGGHCDHSTRPAHRPGPRHQPEQPRLALAPRLSAAAASPGSTSTAGRCSSWTGPSVTPDRVRLCDRDRTGGRLEWAAALFRAFRWSLYRGAQLRVAGRDAPPGLREAGVIHREGLIAARRGLHADGSFAL